MIAGPTASGKSGLGLALAKACNGVVINADAMQVYRDLKVLTARPGERELAAAPHRLYGVIPAGEVCSAGRCATWRGAKSMRPSARGSCRFWSAARAST